MSFQAELERIKAAAARLGYKLVPADHSQRVLNAIQHELIKAMLEATNRKNGVNDDP